MTAPARAAGERLTAMPLETWPGPDRSAWAHASSAGEPPDPAGPAAALSPHTRYAIVRRHGEYLNWLKLRGLLTPVSSVAERITRENVGAFIADRRTQISANTLFANLRMFAMGLKLMAPGHDWSWIYRHPLAPRRHQARAARRQIATPAPGSLLLQILQALDASEAPSGNDQKARRAASRRRDYLLVALALATALRRRNLMGLWLDENIVHRPYGWEILLSSRETKTGRPHTVRVPPRLNRYLDDYLRVDRNVLAGRSKRNAFWLTSTGAAMGGSTFRSGFERVGRELLGQPIRSHSCRHILATTMLTNDPTALDIAAAALGHAGTDTVSAFYDLSGEAPALAVWERLTAAYRPGRHGNRG